MWKYSIYSIYHLAHFYHSCPSKIDVKEDMMIGAITFLNDFRDATKIVSWLLMKNHSFMCVCVSHLKNHGWFHVHLNFRIVPFYWNQK